MSGKSRRRQRYWCSWSATMDDPTPEFAWSVEEAAALSYERWLNNDAFDGGDSIGEVYVRDPKGIVHRMVAESTTVVQVTARRGGKP